MAIGNNDLVPISFSPPRVRCSRPFLDTDLATELYSNASVPVSRAQNDRDVIELDLARLNAKWKSWLTEHAVPDTFAGTVPQLEKLDPNMLAAAYLAVRRAGLGSSANEFFAKAETLLTAKFFSLKKLSIEEVAKTEARPPFATTLFVLVKDWTNRGDAYRQWAENQPIQPLRAPAPKEGKPEAFVPFKPGGQIVPAGYVYTDPEVAILFNISRGRFPKSGDCSWSSIT